MNTRKLIKKRCKELELTVENLRFFFNGWELWLKDKYGEQFCLTGCDAKEIMNELEAFEIA